MTTADWGGPLLVVWAMLMCGAAGWLLGYTARRDADESDVAEEEGSKWRSHPWRGYHVERMTDLGRREVDRKCRAIAGKIIQDWIGRGGGVPR